MRLSTIQRSTFRLMLVVLLSVPLSPSRTVACTGDCNGDGQVSVDELLLGVGIALGSEVTMACPAFEAEGSGVTIADLIAAVDDALSGCRADGTPSPNIASTATPTATRSPTATLPPNEPPVLSFPALYEASVAHEIQLPLTAGDPEEGSILCNPNDLPPGATFDKSQGLLNWTPAGNQLGPAYVPITCSDHGTPPKATDGTLILQVHPLDDCVLPQCDPMAGCSFTLASINDRCCSPDTAVRIPEPDADCPGGRTVIVGRNTSSGFGRLQNCDYLRVVNFAQTGAEVRLNVATRCLNPNGRIQVHVRMETQYRLAVDADLSRGAFFSPRDDGFLEVLTLRFPVNPPTPFFDLDNAEANLTVTLTDIDGVTASSSVRVVTTFDPVPELPDP